MPGTLVISLDFELFWGVRDQKRLEEYRENLLGVRHAIPAMLELFREFDIHTTWAIIGFLFFESREELLSNLPDRKPNYHNPALSPYKHLAQIGEGEKEDFFHYAPSLIRRIREYPHQEIGTHTLSHYYALEPGQDAEAFEQDLAVALRLGKAWNLPIQSLVFPRNQVNKDYLPICAKLGIRSYRGTENSWLYFALNQEQESKIRRAFRLLDAYWNLSGHHCYEVRPANTADPVNLPSSRFLRPVSSSLRWLETLRFRRIARSMEYAARNDQVFHLWWHPHNFGVALEANLSFLRRVLNHYSQLRAQYGMQSLSMSEVAQLCHSTN